MDGNEDKMWCEADSSHQTGHCPFGQVRVGSTAKSRRTVSVICYGHGVVPYLHRPPGRVAERPPNLPLGLVFSFFIPVRRYLDRVSGHRLAASVTGLGIIEVIDPPVPWRSRFFSVDVDQRGRHGLE